MDNEKKTYTVTLGKIVTIKVTAEHEDDAVLIAEAMASDGTIDMNTPDYPWEITDVAADE